MAICAACLGLAVACVKNSEPEYYTLTFEKAEGVTYKHDFPKNYEVKAGVTVSFTVEYADNVQGEPEVKANGVKLYADAEGVFSFRMNGDTTVKVDGIYLLNNYSITFDKSDPVYGGDYRISYLSASEPDKEMEECSVAAGEEISFKIKTSVYYDASKMKVLANTTIVNPDKDGVYTFAAGGDTKISVTDLDYDEWFIQRNDGDGTEENPYKISRPNDLYQLSAWIKGTHSSQFYDSHYELTCDIDMEGEQLYVIGETTENFFAGTFNGNGHKIHNYYMEDTIYDTETASEVFLNAIGLFGVVSVTTKSVPRIYDLNLEDFAININAAAHDQSFIAGGLIGQAAGVYVTGCSVDGVITVDADDEMFGYVGGLAGYIQSAYTTSGLRYYSSITSCASNVEIRGESGHLQTAGGIVGVLSSQDERTAATVLNCYSTGNVYGAMYAGGIAGRVYPYSSVQNCYSTGNIEARNSVGLMDGSYNYAYAYAGGIAGYLECDAIISNSFSTCRTHASSSANSSGANYAYAGGIVGGKDKSGDADVTLFIEAAPALVYNCYSKADNVSFNNSFIASELKWSEGDWKFVENRYPVINRESAENDFTVTLNLGDETVGGKHALALNIHSFYRPVSYWYSVGYDIGDSEYADGDGIEEFAQSGNMRTYGYYFDAARTQKVPFGYTPMHNITLYAGFADYSEAAGEYYLPSGTAQSTARLVLGTDGKLVYGEGALTRTSYYIYNGEYVILYDTCIAMDVTADYGYYSFKATLDGGVMNIFDNTFYPASSPLTAVKKTESFKYGGYYGNGNNVYFFNEDGTGSATVNGVTTDFKYTVGGGEIIVTSSVGTYGCPLDANGCVTNFRTDTLTRFDEYRGVWEKSAGSKKQYFFDGKGNWEYKYFGYDNDGNEIALGSASGAYTLSGGEIILGAGLRASFNADGFLVVSSDYQETFYAQNSFVGVWNSFDNTNPVQIEFLGIGKNGVGVAIVEYGATNGSFEASYAVSAANGERYIEIYFNELFIGLLGYNPAQNVLTGSVYVAASNGYAEGVSFFVYDDLRGAWISEIIENIEFNGLGNYNVAGNGQHMVVSGSITVNGKAAGSYTLNNSTLTGSFTYDNVEYVIAYNEKTKQIDVTYGGGNSFSFELHDKILGLGLIDASGNVYTFDGRGNLSGGGKMTVTDIGGAQTQYVYRNADSESIFPVTLDGYGTIDKVGSDYVLTQPNTVLNIHNPFTGEWLVAGGAYKNAVEQLTQKLEVGAVNADGVAVGNYAGAAVTFSYDGERLAFTHDDKILYVYAMTADGVTELAVTGNNDLSSDGYTVCVKENTLDSFKGIYGSAKTDNYIEFDGLGASKFISGTAVLHRDKRAGEKYEGDIVETLYYYSINEFGVPEFRTEITYPLNNEGVPVRTERRITGVFAEKPDGEYFAGAEKYSVVACDILYGTRVADRADGSISYVFDGAGTLYKTAADGSSEKLSYSIITQRTVKMECVIALTDGSGNELISVYDYGRENATLEVGGRDSSPRQTLIDEKGATYFFDGLTGLSTGNSVTVNSRNQKGDFITDEYRYKFTDGGIEIFKKSGGTETVYAVVSLDGASVKIGGSTLALKLFDGAPWGLYVDEDSAEYVFDGLSNHASGGTLYVTALDSETNKKVETKYSYNIDNGTVTLYNADKTVYGTVVGYVSGGSRYLLTLADGTEIKLYLSESDL